MMNKNILTNGDLVIMNNGKRATYMDIDGVKIFRYHTDKGSFSYVDKYSDDLVHPTNNDYTVVKIYRVEPDTDKKKFGDAIFNPAAMDDYGYLVADRISDRDVWGRNPWGDDDDYEDTLGNFKTGDMVFFANGKTGTVFKNINGVDIIRFYTDTNSFMPFSRFEGMEHFRRPEYNIVKVMRASEDVTASDRYDVICNPEKMKEFGKVVWTREEASRTEAAKTIINLDGASKKNKVIKAILEAIGVPADIIEEFTEEFDG